MTKPFVTFFVNLPLAFNWRKMKLITENPQEELDIDENEDSLKSSGASK